MADINKNIPPQRASIIRDGSDTGYDVGTGKRVEGTFIETSSSPTGVGFVPKNTDMPVQNPVVDQWNGGKTNNVKPTDTTYAVPANPCLNLYDYGHVMWDYGFKWRGEFVDFIARPDVKKIAAFDSLTLQFIVDERNIELNGRKYVVKCTSHYIKDLLCRVSSVTYSTLPKFAVSVAAYKFTDTIINGEYYISSDGRLCYLELVPDIQDPGGDFGGGGPIDNSGPPIGPPAPPLGSGQVFFPLFADDVISEVKETITKPLWSDEVSNLQQHHIDTSTTASYNYQLNVHHLNTAVSCSEAQYQVIYGDYEGKGDRDLGGFDNETLSKAMYTQFAHVLLPHGQEKFTINGVDQDYVYIIKVKRDRYGTSLDPGNWELPISRLTDGNGATTGSSTLNLIASQSLYSGSFIYVDATTQISDVRLTNKVYDVVQGTLEAGQLSSGTIIGNFYPNHGAIVLSGLTLDADYDFNTNRNIEVNGYNPYRLFSAISASSAPNTYTDASGDAIGFKGRRLEVNHSKIFFIRVKNSSFNYSNNPTYVSGSEGVIIDDFKLNEKAYITSVGLYNNKKELLAIGKCSQPVIKTPTEESLFTVKVGL